MKRILTKYFYVYPKCWLLFGQLLQHFTNLIAFLLRFCDPACVFILIFYNNSLLFLQMVLLILNLPLLIVGSWKFVDPWSILELCSCTWFPILIRIYLLLSQYQISAITCFHVCHCWCLQGYLVVYALFFRDLNSHFVFVISSSICNDLLAAMYIFPSV